jgi:hypothetical protein
MCEEAQRPGKKPLRLFYIVKRKPPAQPVVPKSFSYEQKKAPLVK